MTSNPPTQVAFTAGQLVTDTDVNVLVDGINYLTGSPRGGQPQRPYFHLVQTVAQGFANNTDSAFLFDSELADTDNGHSTSVNTSRYTCQTSGTYILYGHGTWVNTAGGGMRKVTFRVNGSSTYWGTMLDGPSSARSTADATGPVPLLAGDYVELLGAQNSGGSLNSDTGSGGARLAGIWIAA